MEKRYVMALDQGTTSSRCILFDRVGHVCSAAQKEFTQIYPKPGWVEHDPMEIWGSILETIDSAAKEAGIQGADLHGTGQSGRDGDALGPLHRCACIQCHCVAGSENCENGR